MKRSGLFLTAVLFFTFSFVANVFAQDDYYYDPAKDPAEQNTTPPVDNSNQNASTENNTSQQSDKTDGYGNPADKYDPRDNYNSNSYSNDAYATDAGYYDDDYETYFYSNRLNRYYRNNDGVNYYSYCYTPSYYNSWGNSYVVSYNPWHQDPWWRWNSRRPRTAIVVYDPFWDWNFGWNNFAYYNSWSNPYWGYNSCNYYGGYSSWGYNGWGNNNGGFCGGYYNGYGNGGGYNNGYNNGYWNGYNDGWNTAYGGGYYYPHHRDASTNNNNSGSTGGSPPAKPTIYKPVPGGTQTAGGSTQGTFIPKEGIAKPFTPKNNSSTGGIKVDANVAKPYVNTNANIGNAKPATGNVIPNKEITAAPGTINERFDKNEKPGTLNNATIQAKPNTTNGAANDNGRYTNTKPFVQQQQNNNADPDGWNTAPPDRWNNKARTQQPAQQQPQQQQPRSNDWNNNSNNNTAKPRGNYNEQPRNNNNTQQYTPQPRNENRFEQRIEQRNEKRAEPRMNAQPQQQQPRMNIQQQQPRQENFNRMEQRAAPQQRNFSPAPQNNGGGFKRK